MKKRIGIWAIEYPTTINGRTVYKTAFVDDGRVSDFVSLEGNGKFGLGVGVAHCRNKRVLSYLVSLSLNVG